MRHQILGRITSQPLAVSWLIGAFALNGIVLYILKDEFGTLSVFLTYPSIFGMLLIVAVLSALGLFAGVFTVGPILFWLFAALNGAKCKVGDSAIVLSGDHRGKVARIYEVTLGQGGQKLFRLDLGQEEKENYGDLFEPYSVAPANKRVEKNQEINESQPTVGREVYERIAEDYARVVLTKDANALYERPAMISLLPDVREKNVFDAGCGPGIYAEWLIQHGAKVVAADYSSRMVELTKQRTRNSCDVHCADLSSPLDFLPDGSFAIVLAPLVMDYIRDWRATFSEFHRILVPSGILVFSILHPCFRRAEALDYFQVFETFDTWGSGFAQPVKMPHFRRPLSNVISSLHESGFNLDALIEPKPTEELRQQDPKFYDLLLQRPIFMCIRAEKREIA